MSYYYSNPGGFSISKTVLPSITSSIYQSAGLNSGGIVRESATVSTTSTVVLPFMQETKTTTTTTTTTNRVPVSGHINSVSLNNNSYLYDIPTYRIVDSKGGTGLVITINYTTQPANPSQIYIINSFSITNSGSGYTSPPIINVYGAIGDPSYPLITTIIYDVFRDDTITTTATSTSPLHLGSFQQEVDTNPKLILLK